MKKSMIVVLLFFSCVDIVALNTKKACEVYSHGFGEYISFGRKKLGNNKDAFYSFNYPNAQAKFSQTPFYTKEAVLTLAEVLYKKVVEEKYNVIYLRGRSMGGGTAINCLQKLCNYDDHPEYFENSGIDREDALKIITAINEGAVVLDAPVLSMHKVNEIAVPSTILSYITLSLVGVLLNNYGSARINIKMPSSKIITVACTLMVGVVLYYLIGSCVKNLYSSSIVRFILPIITGGHFDPNHLTPLESAKALKGKLTSFKLLHVNQVDGVLEDPDEETVQFYEALKNDDSRILISTDASHNEFSSQYDKALRCLRNDLHGSSVEEKSWWDALKMSTDKLQEIIKTGSGNGKI